MTEDSFLGMASLQYYFDQVALEMLSRPSQAKTIIDLQEEIQETKISLKEDVEMEDGRDEFKDILGGLQKELEKAFSKILE